MSKTIKAPKTVSKKSVAVEATKRAPSKAKAPKTKAAARAGIDVGVSQTIPLNLLFLGGNPRTIGIEDGIESLAASLIGRGQLQSLVVEPHEDRFRVITGQRRYLAFSLNHERGLIPFDQPVHCIVRKPADASEALSIAVTENEQRVDMHFVDRFRAYAQMIELGSTIDDIALRHGTSPVAVRQHLKLANLAPALLDAAVAGSMRIAKLEAYAISDDHTAQMAVYDADQYNRFDPPTIRRMLTQGDVTAGHHYVRFIGGVEAYEAAGGPIRRDLFEDGVYLTDAGLLERLVREKLQQEAEALRAAEGWKWARAVLNQGEYAEAGRGMATIDPETVENPAYRAIEQAIASLEENADGLDDDELAAKIGEQEEQLYQLDEDIDVYPADAYNFAGIIVYLSSGGEVICRRGFVLAEDVPAIQAIPEAAVDEPAAEGSPARPASVTGGAAPVVNQPAGKPGRPEMSYALTESLAFARTEALQLAVMGNPRVALVAAVHALATTRFYHASGTAMRLHVTRPDRPAGEEASANGAAITAQLDAVKSRYLPEKREDLWNALADLSTDDLLIILAACAAQGVDTTQKRYDYTGRDQRLEQSAELVQALNFDLADYWTADASYLARISKEQIVAAVTEARSAIEAAPLAGMKKGDAVKVAAKLLEGTRWLPAQLRPAAAESSADPVDALPAPWTEDEEPTFDDEGGETVDAIAA